VLNTTTVPSQLNIAASFDRSLAYAAGLITGKEGRLLNACKSTRLEDFGDAMILNTIPAIALAPRVNILRDPFEGSSCQSYSEDPYLNGQLGSHGVRGIQEQGTMANSKQMGISSTGASAGDANCEVDIQVLHEVYWAPHEELVNAGVATIMCSYSKVNGVPACGNDENLNLTLRSDYNFTGIVTSD
jgi:beta-glucosidase